MRVAETRYEHIILNDKKQPIIQGTQLKVDEFDKEIEVQLRDIDKTKKSLGPTPLFKRLKAKGLI